MVAGNGNKVVEGTEAHVYQDAVEPTRLVVNVYKQWYQTHRFTRYTQSSTGTGDEGGHIRIIQVVASAV